MISLEQIIEDARTEKTISEDYTLLDIQLYTTLLALYNGYKNEVITRDNAADLKQKAINKYTKDKQVYEQQSRLYKQNVECINKTEKVRSELHKAITAGNTVEAFDLAMKIVDLFTAEFKIWRKT